MGLRLTRIAIVANFALISLLFAVLAGGALHRLRGPIASKSGRTVQTLCGTSSRNERAAIAI